MGTPGCPPRSPQRRAHTRTHTHTHTHATHLPPPQGGHGGSLRCANYTEKPCAAEIVADILEYPYMCTVDNAFAKYGGPTRVVYSEANRPGSIYYVENTGTNKGKIEVLEKDGLEAP